MKKRVVLTRPPRESYVIPKSGGIKEAPLPPSIEGVGRGDLSVAVPATAEKEASADSATLTHIKDLVTRLSATDRKALYDHLALLQLGEDESTRDTDMWATAVYDAIVAAIGTGGAGMAGPLAAKRLLGARFSWAPVARFATALGLDRLTVAERLAVFRLIAGLLVERCKGIARHARIPLNAKLVANNTGDLAEVFNDAFPGYVESGLVPLLVRRLVRGSAKKSM